VKKAAVLALFVVALSGAVLVAAERARSLDIVDARPPSGVVSLPAVVRSSHVTVTAALTDRDSGGVIELRFSNDGATWSGWQGFPSPAPGGLLHVPWRLARGTGAKTVLVEARDAAGRVAAFQVSTTLEPSVATR
jgi:hypothetical protein